MGDSRAVLARRKEVVDDNNAFSQALSSLLASPKGKRGPFKTVQLTSDQNPSRPEERARIIRSGGYVAPSEGSTTPLRVWLDKDCTTVGLAMTRCIGDLNVKTIGVIADPEVNSYKITAWDEFLIVASDGVWEFIESVEAVYIVGDYLEAGHSASEACIHLIQIAAKRWEQYEGEYRDDITAIVVRFSEIFEKPVLQEKPKETDPQTCFCE